MRAAATCVGFSLLMAFSLAGCSFTPFASEAAYACHPPPRSEALHPVDGLYVLPDDGRVPIIEELDRALCTIDITIYLISDDAVTDALVRAEARGVEVRILQEPSPFGGGGTTIGVAEFLQSEGIELRPGPDELRFLHAKYMVIDDQVAIVTNQNLTRSAFDSNREFGIVTSVPTNVDTIDMLFEADWSGTTLPTPPERVIVSPVNSRSTLMRIISQATDSIRLYAEVIRDDEVIDALSSAAQQGVDVRVLVNAPDEDLDETVYSTLNANGVDIAISSGVYIHAKALVVDDEIAVIGSHNPTATSLDQNREVSLIVSNHVAVTRVIGTFDADWDDASSLPN